MLIICVLLCIRRVLIIRISNSSPLSFSQQPYPVRGTLDTFALLLKVTAGGRQHAACREDPDLASRDGKFSSQPNVREELLSVVCSFLERSVFKGNGTG